MTKHFARPLATVLLTVAGVSAAHAQTQTDTDNYRHLMMIGGGMELCSSFNPNNCDDVNWIDSDKMRTDRYLDVSEKSRISATSDRVWTPYREDVREKVAKALELIEERIGEELISERVFEREFTRRATLQTYNLLSDAEYAKIIDLLEAPMNSDFPEVVNVEESLDKTSIELFESFAKFAHQNTGDDSKPVVYFSTAGDRDPYAKIDFYQSAFDQLGLEAHWLPLDTAVVTAREQNRCDELYKVQEDVLGAYDRQRVYRDEYQQQVAFCKADQPEYEMVNDADALFITGENANRIRDAFVNADNSPTDLLRMIVSRVQQQKLLVGSTAAGTAALTTKAMISNGTTAEAVKAGSVATNPPGYGCGLDNTCPANTNQDTLTFHPFGGISLFHFGILDAEFSEKGRHGRLVRLAADSSTPLALGIDENTAMTVNLEKGDFNILGERGVFFVENPQSTDNAVAATFHYLVSGASGMMNPNGLQTAEFSDSSSVVKENPTTNFLTDRGLIDSIRVLCGEREQVTLINKAYRLIAQAGDSSLTASAGGECQVLNGKMGIAYQPEEKL